jgi:hypothetical protein
VTIGLATQCAQIEMVVRDVPRACAWFEQVLGAVPIEQRVVQRITGVVLDIDHRDCGDAMFQFCSVITDDMPHRRFIDTYGPCVTNLNFFMDDADRAAEELSAAGADTKLDLPIGAGLAALLGPELARPEEEMRRLYFMGTWPLFGFDLEFTNRPWRDDVEQDVFFPSFTYPRPTTNERVNRLTALRVVVDDVDRTIDNIVTLIDPGSRSEPYGESTSTGERSVSIRLRDLELRCTQVLEDSCCYAERARLGGGIVAAVFSVDGVESIVADATNVEVDRRDQRLRLASREIVGFDVELETQG